jgi:predicted nucleic acid-binding protein
VGLTRYLVDKSALARLHLPAVREELEPLMMRALVGICGVTELEMLYSARNIQERARMKEQLQASLDPVETPAGIWERAAEIQEALAEQAQHRSASIPGLIVAATAAPTTSRSCTTTGTSTPSRASPGSRPAGSSHPARSNQVASNEDRSQQPGIMAARLNLGGRVK